MFKTTLGVRPTFALRCNKYNPKGIQMKNTLTRKQLIEKFAELDTFETKKAATETLDYLLEIITDEVKGGGEVALGQHFGTFKATTQAARSGEMNGVAYSTPAKQVIKFAASSRLKTLIAS